MSDRASRIFLRSAALIVGIATFSLSAWWLAAEAMRDDPALAAQTGVLRGELWLRYGWAAAGGPNASAAIERDRQHDHRADQAEAAFRRSVDLSPMNARAWFGLAWIGERFDWLNRGSSKALKMSYYTGFNDRDLIADRLLLLAQADTSADLELQDLLRQQIRLILSRAPELEAAAARAYGAATEANRKIIAAEYRELGRELPATP
jgi:hypothetical protein